MLHMLPTQNGLNMCYCVGVFWCDAMGPGPHYTVWVRRLCPSAVAKAKKHLVLPSFDWRRLTGCGLTTCIMSCIPLSGDVGGKSFDQPSPCPNTVKVAMLEWLQHLTSNGHAQEVEQLSRRSPYRDFVAIDHEEVRHLDGPVLSPLLELVCIQTGRPRGLVELEAPGLGGKTLPLNTCSLRQCPS